MTNILNHLVLRALNVQSTKRNSILIIFNIISEQNKISNNKISYEIKVNKYIFFDV